MLDLDIVEKLNTKSKKPWWYTGVRDENWGGRRKGAGRPKKHFGLPVLLNINPIQQRLLIEYGNGDLEKGILRLINENF
jgi:hypothetical protein